MKRKLPVFVVVLVVIGSAVAQVASHAPTTAVAGMTPAVATAPAPQVSSLQVSDKPVARVNGVVLTDRDLLREMFSIFPYARQHNGFPKAQEAAIRQGALEMIIFEELVFQDAQRRKLVVPAEKVNRAEADFKKQFNSPDQYQEYMQAEMHGSRQQLRKQIERSILIEQVLKSEVEDRSSVTPTEVKAYYDKTPARFMQPESFAFQSISFLPPRDGKSQPAGEIRKRAEGGLKQASAAKSAEDFGLLAEKISEDDFRVNMGQHKAVERDKLPPQVVKAMLALKPGQVSGLIQIDNAFTIVRLNAHTPARKQPFAEVKDGLRTDLQKSKYEQLRSGLAKRLRAKAKVEVV